MPPNGGPLEGKRVLVYGASGAVGTAAVQLAKHLGAHVTAVCGTKSVELVRSLGADEVVDYLKEDFTKSGKTYDVVFDAVGKHSFRRSRRSLVPGGTFVDTDLGFMWHVPPLTLLTRWIGSKRVRIGITKYSKEDTVLLKELMEAGKYRAVIDRTLPARGRRRGVPLRRDGSRRPGTSCSRSATDAMTSRRTRGARESQLRLAMEALRTVESSLDVPDEAFTARTVVLVEGVSDQRAVEALARLRGRDLGGEGVSVVPMGGAQAIGRFLGVFGPQGLDVRLAGLCDAGEERDFGRALERAGLGSGLTRSGMEELGFYVCVEDLEDELIRALGADAAEDVVEAHGDLGSFRTLQKQPAWRGRPTDHQLRRFMGSYAGKIKYAPLFVEALAPTKVPRPLDALLAYV